MFNCRETRDAVDTTSVRGGLVKSAEEHVDGCSDCRQYVNSTLMLMGMLSAQPRVEAPADFDFRLRARIARARDENRGWKWSLQQSWSRAFSWKESAAAVAVLMAVATSTAFYLSRDRVTSTEVLAVSTRTEIKAPRSTPDPIPAETEGDRRQFVSKTQDAIAKPGRPQINPALVRAVATSQRSLTGMTGSSELSGVQEILIYQPGRAGRPGASRSVDIPRRGQVAFGA
ncbi:MAG: hypothetical protein ABI882_23370, partial [Acidobacteriota bacterium]